MALVSSMKQKPITVTDEVFTKIGQDDVNLPNSSNVTPTLEFTDEILDNPQSTAASMQNITRQNRNRKGKRTTLVAFKYSASTPPMFMWIYVSIGVLGMLGNSLVTAVILKFKRLRDKLTNNFLLNQSLLDMAAACFLLISQLTDDISWTRTYMQAYIFCRLWLSKFILWGCFIASTYNFMVVTMERYVAIVYPMAYIRWFSKGKARVMMVSVWLVCFLWSAIGCYSTNMVGNECIAWNNWPNATIAQFVSILVVVVHYLVPISLLTFAYGRIIYVLRSTIPVGSDPKSTDGDNGMKGPGYEVRNQRMCKASGHMIKTLIVVALCFALCWGPNQMLLFLLNVGVSADFSSWYYHVTVMLTFLNCCVNPIIYTCNYRDFKECLFKMLCGWARIKKPTEMGQSSNLHSSVSTIKKRESSNSLPSATVQSELF